MTISAITSRLGGAAVLGRTIRNDVDLMKLVETGVPKATIRYLADSLGIDAKALIAFLPVTNRNLQRYQDTDLLNDVVSDHIVALAELFAYGESILGKERFRRWLQSPILALGNQTPISFLRTHKGIGIIQDELMRIDYGIFA